MWLGEYINNHKKQYPLIELEFMVKVMNVSIDKAMKIELNNILSGNK
jgi:hypothetical protein